jgi:hypothetical protein
MTTGLGGGVVSPTFELVDDIAIVRFAGHCGFSHVVDRVSQVLVQVRQRNHRYLMLVITELYGFRSPDLAARHRMVRAWAEAAQGKIVVALVARAELIDPERFGVVAAANFGLTSAVFTDEANAFEWLSDHARNSPALGVPATDP